MHPIPRRHDNPHRCGSRCSNCIWWIEWYLDSNMSKSHPNRPFINKSTIKNTTHRDNRLIRWISSARWFSSLNPRILIPQPQPLGIEAYLYFWASHKSRMGYQRDGGIELHVPVPWSHQYVTGSPRTGHSRATAFKHREPWRHREDQHECNVGLPFSLAMAREALKY